MAEFTEVIKQKERMCKSCKSICKECGISSINNGKKKVCGAFMFDCPQESEELIMKWAEEHPVKTNADKFKEVFGDICLSQGEAFWKSEYKEQSND